MLLVPAEHLVGAVSAQCHRAVLSNQPADKESRNHRRVIQWLVILPRQKIEDFGTGIAGLQFDVLGPKMVCNQPRKPGLIIFFVTLKADRKRFDTRRSPCRHCSYKAGIDAAAEQDTNRYIRNQL